MGGAVQKARRSKALTYCQEQSDGEASPAWQQESAPAALRKDATRGLPDLSSGGTKALAQQGPGPSQVIAPAELGKVAKALHVGPIVGISKRPNTLRVWGRAQPGHALSVWQGDAKLPLDCYAYVRLQTEGGELSEPHVEKMRPEDDLTAVVEVEVEPKYRFGREKREVKYWFGVVYTAEGTPLVPNDVERFASELTFRAVLLPSPEAAVDTLRFNFGSCKYYVEFHQTTMSSKLLGIIQRLKGLKAMADEPFGSMLRQASEEPVDLLILAGDQIYADYMPGFACKTQEEYCRSYRDTFRTEQHRKLMASVPTIMSWDDHDLWNNFSLGDLENEGKKALYEIARKAAWDYQMSHSPQPETGPWYYSLGMSSQATFFNADCRSERDNRKQEQLSNQQLNEMKVWLSHAQEATPRAIKFLILTQPLAPAFQGVDPVDALKKKKEQKSDPAAIEDLPEQDGNTDRWESYSKQRQELFDHIKDNKITKVVCLAGDLHVAYHCEITCSEDKDFRVVQLVASAFCWPVPFRTQSMETVAPNPLGSFSDGKKFDWVELDKIYSVCNYGRVTVSDNGETMRFELFDTKGTLLTQKVVTW